VHAKEPLKSLHACGMCPELESIWTIDVSGQRVRDLGRTPVTVELAVVDELIAEAQSGARRSRRATPRVLRALRARLPSGSLGMFEWRLDGRVLRLRSDEVALDFTFAPDRSFVIGL
jgi:hypothetical protein